MVQEVGGAVTNAPGAEKAIEPIRNYGEKVGRNSPCPCGSGKKFKNCHGVLEGVE
jgi:preprotein translocase subunit SecA